MNDTHEFLVVLACNHTVRIWRAPENLEIYARVYCPKCRENRMVMSTSDIDEIANEVVTEDWWS